MKYLLLVAALLAGSAAARDVYVQPHVTKSGAFVEGHYRSAPDRSQYNNYGTQGNVNPYTGQEGRVQPDPFPDAKTNPFGAEPRPYPGTGYTEYCAAGQRC